MSAVPVIRLPNPVERRACRMLLTRATGPDRRSRLYVAVEGEPQRVVGAVAVGMDRRVETRRAWQVDVRVIAPCRGRGIGRALVEHAVAQARAHGVAALNGWEWVEPESETARAWRKLGFSPAQRKLEYEADIAAASSAIRHLYDQVLADGWIPPTARIVPLADADAGAVADLHVRYLGGSRGLLRPLLNGVARDAFHPKYSRVMLLGGRVVGASLGRIGADGVCEVDAHVLHPSVRMGWANLWLKMEAADRLLEDGIRTMRYFGLEQHTDTRRISKQAGCRLVRTLVQMRRELATPGQSHGSPPGEAPAH